jgi:hypothetical protein
VAAQDVDDATEIVSLCDIRKRPLKRKLLLPADVGEMDLHLPVIPLGSLNSDPQ